MPEELWLYCITLYRTYRRFCRPQEALQQLQTTLRTLAEQMHARGDHMIEQDYLRAAHWADNMIELVQMRKSYETLRGRFWHFGKLAGPHDHLLFCIRDDGHRFWMATCPTVACSIKHGMALLRQPQWVCFDVELPSGEILLSQVDQTATLASLTAQLAGH